MRGKFEDGTIERSQGAATTIDEEERRTYGTKICNSV